jgi:hypothetical protein
MTEEEIRREDVRREDRASDRRRWVYPLVIIFVSMFLAVGANIVYTTIAVHRDEQTWCDLATHLDEQYKKTPPANADGKVFAQDIHGIRSKFKCK